MRDRKVVVTNYEWLENKVEYLRGNPTDKCVEWPFCIIKGKGYGQVWTGEKNLLVHRASYTIFNGVEPENLVCHNCDNPPCFNPPHLYDGTHEDNAADMVRRNRANGGDKKLTETHIQEIINLLRDSDMTMTEIGEHFGVKHSTISVINTGKAWKHIPRRTPVRNKPAVRLGKSTSFTEEEAKEIGYLLNNGIPQEEIAERFGVSQTFISGIKLGHFRSFLPVIEPSPHDDRCKLTEKDVIRIINLLESGEFTQAKIGQRFNVEEETIGAIKRGEIWAHLPRPQKWPPAKRTGVNRILSEDQVIEIITLLDQGLHRKEIARRFGISHWSVKDIKYGRRWKHVPRPWTK